MEAIDLKISTSFLVDWRIRGLVVGGGPWGGKLESGEDNKRKTRTMRWRNRPSVSVSFPRKNKGNCVRSILIICFDYSVEFSLFKHI